MQVRDLRGALVPPLAQVGFPGVEGRGAPGEEGARARGAPEPAGDLVAEPEFGGGLREGPAGCAQSVHCPVARGDGVLRAGHALLLLLLLLAFFFLFPVFLLLLRVPARARGVLNAVLVAGDSLAGVLAHVVPQVPAVGDLVRVRGAVPGALGVGAGPVPADHLHARMSLQPRLQRGRLPVRQHVGRDAALHVDQQRRVRVPAPQREVIHAQHPHRPARRLRQRHQHPDQRVPAHLHGQHAGQPGPGPSRQGHRDRSQVPRQQRGPPRVRRGQPGRLLRKPARRAVPVTAGQHPCPQPDHHPPPADPRISQPALVTVMRPGAPRPAPRARRPVRPCPHPGPHHVPPDLSPLHNHRRQVRQQHPQPQVTLARQRLTRLRQ